MTQISTGQREPGVGIGAVAESDGAAGLPPVLFVGDHLGYEAGVVHGVTMYFLGVLPALRAAGLRFSVCFLRQPHPAAEQLARAGVETLFLSAARLNPLVVFRIARLVRLQHIGIIHSSGIKGTLMARIVGRMTGAHVIVHLHDLFGPRWLVKLLHHWWARREDLAICVAAAARTAAVEGFGIDPQRVRTVPNAIGLDRFRQLPADAGAAVRQELGLDLDVPVIAMIGRFYPVKGHRALIRAMARVARARPDAVLLLVGDGPLRAECEELSRQLGLEKRIRFLGQRNDVPELLAAADLVVLPSELEGLPITAIESLAAGRPVVAFDVGGMREVVTDGVDGLVVPAADEPALADAIVALLSDRDRMRRFGEAALRNSARFSVDQHVLRLLECYREVCA